MEGEIEEDNSTPPVEGSPVTKIENSSELQDTVINGKITEEEVICSDVSVKVSEEENSVIEKENIAVNQTVNDRGSTIECNNDTIEQLEDSNDRDLPPNEQSEDNNDNRDLPIEQSEGKDLPIEQSEDNRDLPTEQSESNTDRDLPIEQSDLTISVQSQDNNDRDLPISDSSKQSENDNNRDLPISQSENRERLTDAVISNGHHERDSDQMSSDSNDEDVTVSQPTEEERKRNRQVHFSEDVQRITLEYNESESDTSTQSNVTAAATSPTSPVSPTSRDSLPGMPQLTTEQLIAGVVYQAQYLGSTPIIFSSSQKTVRMQQAREAVQLIKDPENETQPRIDIDLKISTRDLVIIDKKTEVELMVHPLKTVSYVADIEGSLVLMAHRTIPTSPNQQLKLTCHVLDTADPREVAMVIGQAFSTAYKEFLKSNGIKEDVLEQFEYQHVLSSQTKSDMELNSLKDENKTKEITFAKPKGEILGLMIIDSGYGSAIPACTVAHMSKSGAACQSGLINIGDQILSINGTSLVGMPLRVAIEQIKKCRYLTVVKMVTCCCSAVVDVTIMRPDLKFQLGFSVKEGNICSLWRGSIAERSGIRVGHRIIEINGTSAVGLAHEEIVHMLSTTVGDLHIRTMPIVMYQLLTGQLTPEYF